MCVGDVINHNQTTDIVNLLEQVQCMVVGMVLTVSNYMSELG